MRTCTCEWREEISKCAVANGHGSFVAWRGGLYWATPNCARSGGNK